MTPYRGKGRRLYYVKVAREDETWSKEPTGTADRVTAKAMQRMAGDLAGAHAWDVLAAVTARPRRWALRELYRRWTQVPSTKAEKTTGKPIPPSVHERIEVLRAQLRESNLLPLIETWHTVLVGPSRKVSTDTADHYRAAVRGFVLEQLGLERWKAVPADAYLATAALAERALRTHIEEMDDVESATVRKRGQGIRDFTAWLVQRGELALDPMAAIELPPQGAPLCHYIETHEAQLLADAQSGPFRLLSALLAGTGIEVSVALALRRRHVDTTTREIHAAGTKTHSRNRIVRVAEWAWPYVLEAIEGRHPDALLFDAIADRWAAQESHNAAVDALVARGYRRFMEDDEGRAKRYTMRDQRHTWAVRATRSGWPIEGVARQLGHVNGVLALRVYGRFAPTQIERERWEQLAAARDQAMAETRKREENHA